ncbi:MAG TPA: DUF481 domain-containing protein [Nevskiaceae bacterium]
MFRRASLLAVVVVSLVPISAGAQDLTSAFAVPTAPSKKATPWAATATLGYLSTHGNTNSTSANFKGALGHNWDEWANVLRGQANYASDNHAVSAQSWEVGDQLRRALSEREYLFGFVDYLNDRFAGVNERISEAVGYGRRVFESPRQELDLDGGVGLNQQREFGQDQFVTQPMAVFGGAYRFRISDHAQFIQTVLVEAGTKNTYINPVSELKLTIIGNLFATLDYELRYNTSVPEGSVHTDTIQTVNIGYSFGKF